MMVKLPESIIPPDVLREYLRPETRDAIHDPYQVLIDYYEVMDPALRGSSVAYSPAKSTEMGKVDQTMLNHIRNGVWALIELNIGLTSLGSANALSEQELREVIALFSVHDLHKIHGKDWKEQFDISQEEVLEYAEAFGATKFAPGLTGHDFQSVAVALHKSIGFHANLSVKFNLYRPWLTIADTLASIEQPQATPSMQQQLDRIDSSVDFYYHTFQEATGILTNLVHTGIARWASERGLYPLLIFEKGVLYLGETGRAFGLNGEEDIREIYQAFRATMNSSHATFSDTFELQKSLETQGSKGLYSIGNVFFFYSGVEKVAKAFAAAAVLRRSENTATIVVDCAGNVLTVGNTEPDMQYPPAQTVSIPREYITSIIVDGQTMDTGAVLVRCRSEERKRKKFTLIPESVEIDGQRISGKVVINGTGLMTSQIGYRAHIMEDFGVDIGWDSEIIPYSRAISGLRMQLIEPLIKIGALETDDPVLETCRMFGVDAVLAERLSGYARAHRTDDHHRVGGFWNYSYVIARDLLDRDIDGILFADIQSPNEKIRYLEDCITRYLQGVPHDKIQELESELLYPYQEKMLVWISENLDFNGSMFYGTFENKTDKFQAYCNGGGICRLSNDTPYDKERIPLSIGVGMLGLSFSNRLPVGASEPALYVSAPVAIEMGLRNIGHGIKGETDRIYFRLIPDHFYTPVLSRLFSQFLSVFNGDCQTNIRALALDTLSWDTPKYELLVHDLISESGRKNVLRYAGYGYKSLHTTYDIVFSKRRDNDTEYWFFGAYLGLILAAATGCRVVVGENPICMSLGDEFSEMVKLDAPHAVVKRIFGDTIPLTELSSVIDLASLVIVLGYENVMDDKRFPKHLQTLKNKMFPGSSLLKDIWRKYESESRTGAFVNRARGYRNENGEIVYDDRPGLIALALRLDRSGGDVMAVETIHELAELGLTVAIPKGFEPHRVEKLFRESVKAVLAKRDGSFAREDYIDAVSGRLLKMMRRAGNDQFSLIPGLYEFDRAHQFAGAFVDHVFYGLFDGNPGKLKRAANDISDGYYSATLELRDDAYQRERGAIEAKRQEKKEKI
ncbi:MAG: CRISPR-associated protein Csc3 [Methanomicrobiales archaeon 53_19]|nr:MAG: CRISPR-associated protein Csc3 [Methanocalculus sp. 52_23]KUL02466.1 MAG: CRISPR-associated protein Csc3 [Methanomicrobiales archaeon 53_19]